METRFVKLVTNENAMHAIIAGSQRDATRRFAILIVAECHVIY
jgi:hypothetical protein